MSNTKTFNDFNLNNNPAITDYFVGVHADGSAEFRTPLNRISGYTIVQQTSSINPILGGNTASGDYSNISGGYGNVASSDGSNVGGGCDNKVSGLHSVIGGGVKNRANGCHSVVAGGSTNLALGWHTNINGGYANIAGFPTEVSITTSVSSSNGTYYNAPGPWGVGLYNFIKNSYISKSPWDNQWALYDSSLETVTFVNNGDIFNHSDWIPADQNSGYTFNSINVINEPFGSTISGGKYNYTSSCGDVIGGGMYNSTRSAYYDGDEYSGEGNTISGGMYNTVSNYYGSGNISGGKFNEIYGDCSTVGGGYDNYIDENSDYSTIGGGCNNHVYGQRSTIGGGSNNCAWYCQTIGGGYNNCANTTRGGTIAGGHDNKIEGTYSVTIGGGSHNYACGSVSTISGGCNNNLCGYHGVIGGGAINRIGTGEYSSVIGGCRNDVDTYSNSHIIGSDISATRSNTTFVNNLVSMGTILAAQGTDSGDISNAGFAFGPDGDTGLFSPIVGGGAGNGKLALKSNGTEVLYAEGSGLSRITIGGISYNVSRNSSTGALTLTP